LSLSLALLRHPSILVPRQPVDPPCTSNQARSIRFTGWLCAVAP
jgi:hypothetical protein